MRIEKKMGNKNLSNENSREKKLTIEMKEIKQRTATTYNDRHRRRQMGSNNEREENTQTGTNSNAWCRAINMVCGNVQGDMD